MRALCAGCVLFIGIVPAFAQTGRLPSLGFLKATWVTADWLTYQLLPPDELAIILEPAGPTREAHSPQLVGGAFTAII
jgi:hypothetical protein